MYGQKVKHWLGSYCNFVSGVINSIDSKKLQATPIGCLHQGHQGLWHLRLGALIKKVKHWLGSHCKFTSGIISGEDTKKQQATPIECLHLELQHLWCRPGVLVKKVKHGLGSYCRFTSGVISGEDSKKTTSHAHWTLTSRTTASLVQDPVY